MKKLYQNLNNHALYRKKRHRFMDGAKRVNKKILNWAKWHTIVISPKTFLYDNIAFSYLSSESKSNSISSCKERLLNNSKCRFQTFFPKVLQKWFSFLNVKSLFIQFIADIIQLLNALWIWFFVQFLVLVRPSRPKAHVWKRAKAPFTYK